MHGIRRKNGSDLQGVIKFRRVSKLQFYLVVLLVWGWLDDDSNEDTTDLGYLQTLAKGQRYQLGSKLLRPWIKKVPQRGTVIYGNAFDLGDVRARYAFFNPVATFFWNNRNTAMNWQYLLFRY